MTFTPEIWKKQVSERLDRFGDWMKKRGEREVPNLVYGGLCGMTLWPLVEATQSGLLMPAAFALGSIAGGVGGNLIAAQLEKWKERADEAGVHEWVAEQAPKNPELRDALDAIMENFDVMARAEAGLDEEDRAWFSETLEKELQQLGNLPRYEARLTGDGAIARGDGSRAVGKGGVLVDGDVGGDVVGKNKTILFDQKNQQIKTQYNIAGDGYNGPAPKSDDKEFEKKPTHDHSKSPLLPLGVVEFEKIITRNYYYIDKTMLIREVLDEGEIILITRPRRFGKTLNQDMLRCFFEKSETDKSHLFEGLSISGDPAGMKHQGSYPVIYLTFKDAKEKKWDACLTKLKRCIIKEYRRHEYLVGALGDIDKKEYMRIMRGEADEQTYAASIELLTGFLHDFHKKQAIVLIDEYDTPVIEAYNRGYYEDAILFIRNMLGMALKDNDHIEKGVLTGILRIARESIFSELNNLRVFSMLDAGFSDMFGLTEAEVEQALDHFNLLDHANEVARWYNGYSVAGRKIYNPWSIINFLKDRQTKAYWVNTSDNALVYDLVGRPEPLFQNRIKTLLAGESIDTTVNENIVFSNLAKSPDAIWTVLFFSGYFTLCEEVDTDLKRYKISIPNHEVKSCFKENISRWMNKTIGNDKLNEMLQALIGGDVDRFSERLQYFVKTIWSYYDAAGQEPEKVYHAFFLGLLINLESRYEIRSNRESGYGRYDVMMAPRKPNGLGIVMEFKKVGKTESPEDALQAAFDQIRENEYEAELRDRKIETILLVAIALEGKEVTVKGIRV